MATVLMTYNKPKVLVADTQAGLDTGDAFECQITVAQFTSSVTMATTPSTGCTGPGQSPSGATWSLHLEWLEDWTEPGGGLSGYAFTNGDPSTRKWVRLQPDKDDATVQADAEVWVTPGQIGGTFGDGSASVSRADWPLIGKPDMTFPAATP